MGIGTPWKAAALLAVGAAGGAAAVAVAGVPDGNVIHACYEVSAPGSTVPVATPGNVRIIDTNQTCSTTPGAGPIEHPLDWNVTGPAGPPGTPGAPGKTATVVAGQTLTISGGQVITVGQVPTLTIQSPPEGTRNVASLSFTGGLTTPILGYGFASHQGAGSVHDMQVTRQSDKSSAKLALACAKGTHFKQATVRFGKGKKLVTYTMTSVFIASYQLASGKGSGKTIDSLTLAYTKLAITS